jgi:GNAT superfamily N-acetyltransferase
VTTPPGVPGPRDGDGPHPERAAPGAAAVVRPARPDEEDAVLALVGADEITRSRVPGPWPSAGQRAGFRRILAADDHELLVALRGADVVGVLQLSFLPEFARDGDRAQLETMHVAEGERRRGTGRALVEDAVARARARGCGLVQLTSGTFRPDAHRFYAALGFEPTHVGFKRQL